MKLKSVFSSCALFQANSTLTINGLTDKKREVTLSLQNSQNEVVLTCKTESSFDGSFELSFQTPAASFEEYSLTVTGDETIHISNILFGELWLASGQSNMNLPNNDIPENELILKALKNKEIRIFHVGNQGLWNPAREEFDFPFEPKPYGEGEWISANDTQKLLIVSAIATKFANDVYDYLNQTQNIPFGILDASWGGTPITAWLKKSDIDEDEEFKTILKRVNKYPDMENWNQSKGCCNYQQTSAQYNIKIEQLVGCKIRGIIWYQGENEADHEYETRTYAHFLRFYYKTYKKRFACDENFLMLSSLIHYWIYGGEGDCLVGYLNEAFIKTAIEEPEKFAFVSNGDLEPVWAQHHSNHPIHPVHKYPLAARMAKMALANVYGAPFKKRPATLLNSQIQENSIRVFFRDAEEQLQIRAKMGYIKGKEDGYYPVKTLYVAGEDHRYLPAEARILEDNSLEVRSDSVIHPLYVAYNMGSLEPHANLFCGEYPVSPFYTDTENQITIESLPWYDLNNTTLWAEHHSIDTTCELFTRPVFKPSDRSEVCHDSVFCFETDQSLRVSYDFEKETTDHDFGCYVTSYPFSKLDFTGFTSLQMNLFNYKDIFPSLILQTEKGEFSSDMKLVKELGGGWARFSCELPKYEGDIQHMVFHFTPGDGKKAYFFANIERIRLIK